jgi:hypothetical protein
MVVVHIQVRLLFLIYEPNDLFVYLRLKDRDQDFTFTYNSRAYIETKIVMLTTRFCSHLLTLMLADTYYHNQILSACSARKRRGNNWNFASVEGKWQRRFWPGTSFICMDSMSSSPSSNSTSSVVIVRSWSSPCSHRMQCSSHLTCRQSWCTCIDKRRWTGQPSMRLKL